MPAPSQPGICLFCSYVTLGLPYLPTDSVLVSGLPISQINWFPFNHDEVANPHSWLVLEFTGGESRNESGQASVILIPHTQRELQERNRAVKVATDD